MSEYQQLMKQLLPLGDLVGEYMRNEIDKVLRSQIEEKDINSLVSYVDKTSEEMIVETLAKLIPEAGFITEEKTIQSQEKEIMWIVDPLDGTTNYLFGIPHYSTSIALKVNGEIVLGLVRDNAKGEAFHAIKGQGAYLNNNKLLVSKNLDMANSIFVTGFPYSNDYTPDAYLKIIQHWLKNSRGVRRFGSAALDLAYVAASRVSCYYEGFLNIWDIAAGALIAQEAGAIVSDFKGGKAHLESCKIIACNPTIYPEVLHVIKTNLS